MNNPLGILAGILVCSATLPVFLSTVSYNNVEINEPQKQEQSIDKEYINYESVDKTSPKINIYNHKTGKTQKMNIEEYLYGVLSGEMPSDFDIEALKAQAVAARTYVMYNQEKGWEEKILVMAYEKDPGIVPFYRALIARVSS